MTSKYKMRNKSIDAYIGSQPVAARKMLKHIRSIIRSVVPDAEEVISYQVPSYKYHGMLVGLGVHKNGCSLYTMNARILGPLSKELNDLTYSRSTIHFNPQRPLPVAFIKKLVRQRMKENEERAAQRSQSRHE